jgi:hypothetical protein
MHCILEQGTEDNVCAYERGSMRRMEKVVQGDSKLLPGFPWPIIFKPEITK